MDQATDCKPLTGPETGKKSRRSRWCFRRCHHLLGEVPLEGTHLPRWWGHLGLRGRVGMAGNPGKPKNWWQHIEYGWYMLVHLMIEIRPHRRCWGVIFRMALVKGYRFTWGGGIFRPKPPVFDRSWRSPSKNTVKNSTEDTCSWTRPSKIGKRKVKKNLCFSTFWPQFFGLQHLFLRFRRWPGPEADFWVFGPVFGLIFVVLW